MGELTSLKKLSSLFQDQKFENLGMRPAKKIGSGYFAVDGNLPLESILP